MASTVEGTLRMARSVRRRYVAIALIVAIGLLVVAFQRPLRAHSRAMLFLSQELPQSPVLGISIAASTGLGRCQ
jgi:hypothetical protein